MAEKHKIPSLFEDDAEDETTDVNNLESVYGGFLRHLAEHSSKLESAMTKFSDETRKSIDEMSKAMTGIAVQQGRMDERLNHITEEIKKDHTCLKAEDIKALEISVGAVVEQRTKKRDEANRRKWIVIPIIVTITLAMVPVVVKGVYRTYDVLNIVQDQSKQISDLQKRVNCKTDREYERIDDDTP